MPGLHRGTLRRLCCNGGPNVPIVFQVGRCCYHLQQFLGRSWAELQWLELVEYKLKIEKAKQRIRDEGGNPGLGPAIEPPMEAGRRPVDVEAPATVRTPAAA